VELWCQALIEGGTVMGSQYAPDYPFDAWVADDWYSDAGLDVNAAEVWGGNWGGDGTGGAATIEAFVVWIWMENGNCVPGDPPIGTEVYQEYITVFDIQEIGAQRWHAEFDMPAFTPDVGQSYWIAFQPVQPFTPTGQCGVSDGEYGGNCPPMQHFEAAGLLVWTDPGYPGMAFCLHNSESTAASENNWSAVKALY
jgi:hypothetical protein